MKLSSKNITIIYSPPTCGYCDLLKEDLVDKEIEFNEIDVSKNPEKWSDVENLSGGDRITPLLVKPDGTVEVGYKGIGCNYS